MQQLIEKPSAVLLFSGGRDSSLAACLLAEQQYHVHLLTTSNGASVKGEVSEYRYQELKTRFPKQIVERVVLPTFGLFRRLAIADIERDFATYRHNLILVGDQLATHSEAILYCLDRGISVLASGFTIYEADYPEQMPEVVPLFRSFAAAYGIEYLTPVYSYSSADSVKYRLFEFGISTKSLEGCSLFADSFTTPPPAIVCDYVNAKLSICRDYIDFRRRHRQSSAEMQYVHNK